ncbi:hypothetical protein AMAG_06981 [Allomyces macrogynus ATCC 38327]|uniref:Uncharacterized protein n=1 Tax=Allomyces macrogynus (strain ATCC 38327) TaxID=578462 RepID=A0A0L0SFK1_ALLM3|nr:hypothetical protein AMAG_06981 [Allomyces macrogynus ATCC 38327]|eukprot:KNE61232.1 hypothetical protein AMAG_06981 [Allomyces macrogynus ATCC 38327]
MLSSPIKSKPVTALAARPSSLSRSRAAVVVAPKSVADWVLPMALLDLPLRPATLPNVDTDTADHDEDDETVGYADEAAEMQGILHTFWHEVDRADWIISLALRAAFPHAYAGTESGAESEDEEDEDEVDSDPDEEAKKKKDDEEKKVPMLIGLGGGFPLLDVPDAALDALERVLGGGAAAVQVATEPVPT